MITDINCIESAKREYQQAKQNVTRRIILCMGTGCLANGSQNVHDAFLEELKNKNVSACTVLGRSCKDKNGSGITHLSGSGCQGFCQMGPLVSIEPDGVLYCKVKPEDVREIVEQTVLQNIPVERLLYKDPIDQTSRKGTGEITFYARQKRFVLEHCGKIDPDDIREYIYHGGYESARRAYQSLSAEAVCKEIAASGLRGRGGGGFPTGKKWDLTRIQSNPEKYVICNGDEGDPGAFMDRSVMEGNPHSVLEGMLIAARAIGATEGYVYVRAEYPLAVKRIRKAVTDAAKMGLLGNDLFGTSQRFMIHVMEGAGAFVCGEETALIASIEGKRGMPSPKPPFPAQSGLWGKPTVINNVETLATVPRILAMGTEAFRKWGTANSPGTKTFALTGHVVNTGLIEVPFGATLREIIFDIGGGVTDDTGEILQDGFKAVQIGGPSGGCLIQEHLDLPLDFDSLRGVGAMVGSGGLVVMNKNTCMVSIAQFFMKFTQNESCGKCVPCREGTRQMLAMLDDIAEGRGTKETLETLETLARAVRTSSLCGLGKTAPNPVLSTLRYFRHEYEAHVFEKRCPANQCKALRKPEILRDLCKGCTLCARKCPVGAISGSPKQCHTIDAEKCVRCGVCATVCKFHAIVGV